MYTSGGIDGIFVDVSNNRVTSEGMESIFSNAIAGGVFVVNLTHNDITVVPYGMLSSANQAVAVNINMAYNPLVSWELTGISQQNPDGRHAKVASFTIDLSYPTTGSVELYIDSEFGWSNIDWGDSKGLFNFSVCSAGINMSIVDDIADIPNRPAKLGIDLSNNDLKVLPDYTKMSVFTSVNLDGNGLTRMFLETGVC